MRLTHALCPFTVHSYLAAATVLLLPPGGHFPVQCQQCHYRAQRSRTLRTWQYIS